jgi:phage major head subunit gpT-like protein
MAENIAKWYAAVEPVTRKWFNSASAAIEEQFSKIADVSSVDVPIREFSEWAGPQQLEQKDENVAMRIRTTALGTPKRVQVATFAGAMEISREAVSDVKIDQLKTPSKALGRAAKKTPEYLFAQFLDRSHNSAFPVTADNVELCSASHITPYGVTAANTLATPAALSETSLEDIRTALRTTIGPDGMLAPVMAKAMIVPSSLDVLSEKLARSEKTLGSANNDPSVVQGMKRIVFDYLTNTTRWYVQTDAEDGFYWNWREKPTFERDNVALTMQAIFITFFRAMWGAENWRCVFASNAT